MTFQILGTVLPVGVAALTGTWLIMHLPAKDDPAKIVRAKLWNPLRVAKVVRSFGTELVAARRARKRSRQ